MNIQHLKITHAYHFISEAIIVYLLILPIMYHYYLQIPYLVYMLIILGLALLYSIFAKYTQGHVFYLLSIPFLVAIFFIVGYPLGLSIVFSGVLTWRYIAIRSEMYLKREHMYIIVTLVLSFVCLLFIRDLMILLFFVLQLINIIVGYILSNIAVTSKSEQKQLNMGIWPHFIAYFSLATGLILSISDILQNASIKLWEIVRITLVFFATLLFRLVPDIDFENLIDWEKLRVEEIALEKEGELGPSIWKYVATFATSYILITFLIILFGVYLIIRQLRSRVKFRDEEETTLNTSHSVSMGKNSLAFHVKSLFKWLFIKPSNPVRKMVFEFERMADKNKKGRKKFETVEDWLNRIGLTTNLITYQKVRYGDFDISDGEIQELKEELRKMTDFIMK